MKIFITVVAVLFVVAGFLGRPYIDMLQDGQSLECVMQQMKSDLVVDESLSATLSAGANKLSCQAGALFD